MRILTVFPVLLCSLLLLACESNSSSTNTAYRKPVTDATNYSGILIIHEDPPFNESMVNWRVKNAMMSSFTKGEKEEQTLKSTIRGYAQPSEYTEKEIAAFLAQSLNVGKKPKTISYKNKSKPNTTLQLMKEAHISEQYVLDVDINKWELRPAKKDNFVFWLLLDMDMMLIDMQKDTVLVHQKCYFDEQDEAHSQYKIFKDDAALLNTMIRNKAAQCVEQFKTILGNKKIV